MSFQLPESVVDALLGKLASDDAFRDRFAIDPRAALAALGFAPAADATVQAGIWKCMAVSELASRESIRAAHVQLRAQLLRLGMYTPFHLQAPAAIQRCA
jgi:putative modified peptide